MPDQKQTTSHEEIRTYAGRNGFKPAQVQTDADSNQHIIRLMQPGAPHSDNDNMEEISWDRWFKIFEEQRLALVYDAENQGEESFNKLVSR